MGSQFEEENNLFKSESNFLIPTVSFIIQWGRVLPVPLDENLPNPMTCF